MSRLPSGPTVLTPEAQARLEVAVAEFDSEVTYLNTATLGLPPRRSWDALQAALQAWRAGRVDAVAYDVSVDAARAAYARLVGVEPSAVATGSQVSALVGLIASNLPPGSEVLTASMDFTSVLFPFHAQAVRGVVVREAPLDSLAEAVEASTSLVAVSAVQSANGRLADLDALVPACAATGTRVLVDVTHAAGWLPIDASRFAYTVCAGYKWLLSPRGTAYLTVQPDLVDELIPHAAGWYAGAEPWESVYGSPIRLASDARRFDVSPAWHAWVGAAPALELLIEVGVPTLHAHALRLANRFCAGAGLPESDSAIVSALGEGEVATLMQHAGIVGAERNGRLRLSFHLSTTADDVDHAVEVLAGRLRP